MSSETSNSSRLFAAMIMVPLVVVAGLVAFNLYSDDGLESEARVLAATLDRTLARDVDTARQSLAVLPLRNLSGDSALDYLAAGVAADIRDQLANVAGLKLIGDESSSNVASQPLSLASAARLLGVRHILHGSIRGDTGQLVVDLEMHAAHKDTGAAWRETWHSPTDNLPTMTHAIAARVLTTLLPGQSLASSYARDGRSAPPGEALDNFMRGKYLIDRYNRDDVLSGIEYMGKAIALDPRFERAYWGKIAGHQRMTWIDAQTAEEHNAIIYATVEAWLALDVETPLTHRLRAYLASKANRYVDADAAFRRAVQLAPQQYAYDRSYMIDLCMAGYLARCLEQARGIARNDPVSAAAHSGLATVYQLLDQHDRMLEHGALSTRFGGDLGEFHVAIGLLREGQWEEGAAGLTLGLERVGVASDWVDAFVAALADPSLVEAAVAEMSNIDEASAGWLDLMYSEMAELGRLDLAFELADRLIAEDFETWNLYLWESHMAPFRNDPRFIPLMDAAGMLELWQTLGPPDLCNSAQPEAFCARLNSETLQ